MPFNVTFLDEMFNLLIELVTNVCIMAFNFMKFIPLVRLITYNVILEGRHRWNIISLEDLSPCLFKSSVKGREVIHRPHTPLERLFVLYR